MLFFISFLLYSYNSLAGVSTAICKSQNQQCFIAKNNSDNGNTTQQLSEKNENETENENNYTEPVFDSNFQSACFQLQVGYDVNASPPFLSEKKISPIYIFVRDFRIWFYWFALTQASYNCFLRAVIVLLRNYRFFQITSKLVKLKKTHALSIQSIFKKLTIEIGLKPALLAETDKLVKVLFHSFSSSVASDFGKANLP